jgi:hypothetical protein
VKFTRWQKQACQNPHGWIHLDLSACAIWAVSVYADHTLRAPPAPPAMPSVAGPLPKLVAIASRQLLRPLGLLVWVAGAQVEFAASAMQAASGPPPKKTHEWR